MVGWLSVMVAHGTPPSTLFHTPPPAVPANITFVLVGSTASASTLPLTLPYEKSWVTGLGPSSVQAFGITDGTTARGATSATVASPALPTVVMSGGGATGRRNESSMGVDRGSVGTGIPSPL